MRFPKLTISKKIVALVTIVALLASVAFFDSFVKKTHPKLAPTSALAVTTAPARVDTATQQVQFHYAIQSGDQMGFIAKASCSNAQRAGEFATANGITNPNWIIAGKDMLTVLPQGCAANFTPRRAIMTNRVRSATADSETHSEDEPPATIPVTLTTSAASTFAIQWQAPAYNHYWWPTFADLAQASDANMAATVNAQPLPVPVQTTAPAYYEETPAKGHSWYSIHIAPGRKLPLTGAWAAMLLNNQKPEAGKKSHLGSRTVAIVVSTSDDGVDIFTQVKTKDVSKLAKESLVFVDGSGTAFPISAEFVSNHGTVTAFGPVALPKANRANYRAVEQVFPLAQSPLARIAKFGIPLAASTATGFLAGGPVGVAVSDSIFFASATVHHFQSSAAKKLMEPQR